MSSAENDLDFTRKGWGFTDAENGTRPVWISEADARMYGGGLLRAWDAAPADPAEAVLKALAVYPWERNKMLVLTALGYPKETP